MNSLAEIQTRLCAALSPFRNERELEAGAALVRQYGTLSNPDRLAIYRHNVSGAHIAALESIYPVCREVIGERVFATLAREYAWRCPTTDPDLNRYGVGFPDFLREHDTELAALPYLHDLALLEYHWHQALFAPDDLPFDYTDFADAANRPERLVFTLSASLYPMQSDWPVFELWRRHRNGEAPREIRADGTPDRLAIVRAELEVEIVRVDAEAFALLEAIASVRTLTQLSTDPRLAGAMTRLPNLVARGWICGFRLENEQTGQTGVQ